MQLELASGKCYKTPQSWEIDDALGTLDGEDNNFAILSREDEVYIQTCGTPKDGYVLEYREGTDDTHYQSVREDIPIREVREAFTKYASGDESWRGMFEWKLLDLRELVRKERIALAWVLVPLGMIVAAALVGWLIKAQ